MQSANAVQLPERQRLILKEIVDRYIRLREPVSSRMILEDYGLTVSSATVRNDMNDLEAAGFIEKPYSSSGRIPTRKGYRFFVDWLLDLSDLTREERLEIVEMVGSRCLDVEQTIRQTAFLLGNITGCASFVIPPRPEETKLDRVVLLRMDKRLAFLLILSDIGIVEHGLVPLDDDLAPDEIDHIMRLINENLPGVALSDVRSLLDAEEPDGWYERSARQAILVLQRLLQRRLQRPVRFDGLLNLTDALQQAAPERAMADFASFSRAVRDEAGFIDAVSKARGEQDGIVVSIGNFPLPGLEEFSVVTAGYRPHGGAIGVVGPLWMDYGRALSTVSYVANRLEGLLANSAARGVGGMDE